MAFDPTPEERRALNNPHRSTLETYYDITHAQRIAEYKMGDAVKDSRLYQGMLDNGYIHGHFNGDEISLLNLVRVLTVELSHIQLRLGNLEGGDPLRLYRCHRCNVMAEVTTVGDEDLCKYCCVIVRALPRRPKG